MSLTTRIESANSSFHTLFQMPTFEALLCYTLFLLQNFFDFGLDFCCYNITTRKPPASQAGFSDSHI